MDIRRRMLFKKKASSSGGGGSTTGGSYTVNLNSQWEKTTAVTNPDSTLYDGVYRSSSNYNVNSGVATMYITIKDCSSFKMYIRSYAESNFDYVMVSQLDKTITGSSSYSDTTLVKAHTRGNQQSGTTLSSYTLVEFTGISSGEHTITVVYRKDSSVNNGDDRGYVLISKVNEGYGTVEPEEPGSEGSSTINVGDIAYWDGSKVKTVSSDKWSTSLGTPVGVVVIPEGFAPDGKVRIIGLKPVDSNGNQSVSHVVMTWGPSSTDTSLTNYTKVPTTDNAGSTSTGSNSYGYLPSDKFTGAQSYVDPEAKYYGSSNLISSPYLGDAPNPEYYKTISGYNNALSDFNGLSNTQTLVDLGSNYQAANACWKYKDGASNLQWYLPAMGELGYLMPRFNLINESLTAVSGVAVDGGNDFWSSSEFSLYYAFYLSTYSSSVSYLPKDYDGYVRPFCTIENNNGINTDDYLTIEARENGLTASLSVNACEYCVDGDGNWKSLAAGTATESINTGHTLSFRGELTPTSSYGIGIGTFTISKKCNLKGNCMSMLFGDNAANNFSLSGKSYAFYKLFNGCSNIINVSSNFLPATTLEEHCYGYMFQDCTSLITAPELPAKTLTLTDYCYRSMFSGCTSLITAPTLPATGLAIYCYSFMFYGCTSLTTAPELPATSLTTGCYDGMFKNCTSLKTAPILPATTLKNYCYSDMFYGCTSLTTAPSLLANSLATECYDGMFKNCTSLKTAPRLPATSLANYCYGYMFYGCKSLTTAPELPATTLTSGCYEYMFNNCTSLTTAPELPATTLTSRCYEYMFYKCTKLNYIKMLATNISASQCLESWLYDVSSTGTFVKHPNMTSLPTGSSGIPSGWTVVNDGEESDGNSTFPVTLVEGDNGQLGIDLFNYLIDKYDEQVSFNEHSITEQITINSTSGSRYNGDVINILTQLNSLQETPTWIRLATQSVLNQGYDWFTCDYFILRNNGYLEYYND